MSLLDILQGTLNGRYHQGDILESREGVTIQFVTDRIMLVIYGGRVHSTWDITSIVAPQLC